MKIARHSAILKQITPDAERLLETAGRICWKSEDRITDASHVSFIRMIKQKNHESVLEHASASFSIVTDRGISHELVRHRIASYSQSSTRYCDYNSGKFDHEITVIKPVDLVETDPAYEAWKAACLEAERRYKAMRDHGATAQIARSVLPTCLMTEVFMTANFREWRHFLTLRLSPGAHPDMRVVAGCIRDALVQAAPTVFEEWGPTVPS